MISVRGDWTGSLYNLGLEPYAFNECTNYLIRKQLTTLTVNVNGPFASPMQSITKNKIVICVAAGVGITAYIAILRNLL